MSDYLSSRTRDGSDSVDPSRRVFKMQPSQVQEGRGEREKMDEGNV